MKHLEHTLETYVYSHCNVYNIPIYFCNTNIKHLQHTSEKLETYVYIMCFQHNIFLLLGNGGSSARRVHRCRARRSSEEGRGRSGEEGHSGSLRWRRRTTRWRTRSGAHVGMEHDTTVAVVAT
jgi:hypothetical protein